MEIEEIRIQSPDGYRELDPGANLTVEHILPKKPASEWSAELSADTELVADCIYRLGNVCLLAKANRTLGRKGFSAKKIKYAESGIKTTAKLSEFDSWGRTEIEGRQDAMSIRALNIWNFQ